MKLKLLLFLMLLLPMSSMAQKVAYAVFKDSTLTFYYNDKKPEGAYDVENLIKVGDGSYYYGKEWDSELDKIKTVVFDKSIKEYRPKRCDWWFYLCKNLTSVVGIKENLNTSEVTDMSNMFWGCKNLTTLDVSGFNTENVTDMSRMFEGCEKLTTLDVSGFKTDKVTSMGCMFEDCKKLTTLDVSGFSTDNVTSMGSMFNGCISLTKLDVSGFNTENVTYMEGMFRYCEKLTNLDISNFNTANVNNMDGMFEGCNSLKTIYAGDGWNTNRILFGWSMFSHCPGLIGGKGTKYDKNHTGREYAHIDGGKSYPGYFTRKTELQSKMKREAYAVLKDSTLTFFYRKNKPKVAFDVEYWIKIQTNRYQSNKYSALHVKEWTFEGQQIKTVVFDKSFIKYRPKSCNSWFALCENLTSIKGMKENLNTSEVTDMSYMFYHCNNLTSLDVSGLNTENVTNMDHMFAFCSNLTSLDVSGFNTENVTVMRGMFGCCANLTSLNVSSFNTANVTNMVVMFSYCENLRTIYVGDGWNTSRVDDFQLWMFKGCPNLIGGRGTKYDASHTNESYAHIDGGSDNPGYFTKKPKSEFKSQK